MKHIIALCLLLPGMACADNYFTYNGAFADGGSVSGYLNINPQKGWLDSGSVVISNLPQNLSIFDGTYTPIVTAWGALAASRAGEILLVDTSDSAKVLKTQIPGGETAICSPNFCGTGLVGYSGQNICADCKPVTLTQNDVVVDTVTSGQIIDPPAPTAAPEISANDAWTALTLLAVALMAMCGKRRRRE